MTMEAICNFRYMFWFFGEYLVVFLLKTGYVALRHGRNERSKTQRLPSIHRPRILDMKPTIPFGRIRD